MPKRTARKPKPRPADTRANSVPLVERTLGDALIAHAAALRSLGVIIDGIASNIERVIAASITVGGGAGTKGRRPRGRTRTYASNAGPAKGSRRKGRR